MSLRFFIALGCLLCLPAARAQTLPPASTNRPVLPASVEHIPPPLPSPVAGFRELLAADEAGRFAALSNRSPVIRERIMAKIREYKRMTPEDRELRLRTTELKWYLTPLLSTTVTNRAAALAQVPESIRPLVEERLKIWAIFPPEIQRQILEDDRHVDLYLQLAAGGPEQQQALLERLPPAQRSAVEAGFARWQKMTETQRQQSLSRVKTFFELQPTEKRQTLAVLSEAERAQMERTLQAFEKLAPDQRNRCLNAFGKFANLSPGERAQFLVSAERWQSLAPSEREMFRKLVQQAPMLPPLPPGLRRLTHPATNGG